MSFFTLACRSGARIRIPEPPLGDGHRCHHGPFLNPQRTRRSRYNALLCPTSNHNAFSSLSGAVMIKSTSSRFHVTARKSVVNSRFVSASNRRLQQRPQRRILSNHAKRAKDSPNETLVDDEMSVETVSKQLSQLVKDPSSLEVFGKQLTAAQRLRLAKLVEQPTAPSAASTTATTTEGAVVEEPSAKDLRLVAFNTCIPFIGFGIMDNAILILAGDAIDHSLGVWLGISTMCAAAIGNIVSDVAGVMLGTVVEDCCARYLRMPVPLLSTAQRQLQSVRFANQLGCALGLVIGCIIGMFPLLLLDSQHVQAKKRQVALDQLFQDVVNEAGELVNAQRMRLYIVCRRPEHKEGSSQTTLSGRNFLFVGGSKQTGLVLPAADGDYLYAKYSRQVPNNNNNVGGTSVSTSTRTTTTTTRRDSSSLDERWIPLGRGIVSRAALTGEVWNIENVIEEPDYRRDVSDSSHDFKPRNMLCVPVLDGNGNTIAVLQALNKIAAAAAPPNDDDNNLSSSSFTDSDVQILQALASHVSVSLQRMYYEASEKGAEEEKHSLKDTIRILKDSGLMAMVGSTTSSNGEAVVAPTTADGTYQVSRAMTTPRTPLFPADE